MVGGDAGRGSSGVGIDWTGIGVRAGNSEYKSVIKHEFYVQFAVYADQLYRDFWYGTSGSPYLWGGKIAIVESPDSSFDYGEVVLTRVPRAPGGFVQLYRLEGPSPAGGGSVNQFWLYYPSVNDWVINGMFDRGTPSVTSVDSMQRRHGLNYGNGPLGHAYNASNVEDADIEFADQPRLVANGWTVFEIYVKQVSSGKSVVKMWMAPYGEPPVLVSGAMDANLPYIGSMDGSNNYPREIYSGLQLTNYHNQDQGTPLWPAEGQDTFISYAEIIASESPIDFPGGHTLPHPGIESPPNYPPQGAAEK
jgi:hypothetical protein